MDIKKIHLYYLKEWFQMGILLDILTLSVYLPFLKPDENDIVRNIKHLKEKQWFNKFLKDPVFKDLIIHNEKIRRTSGRVKTCNIRQYSYNIRFENRLRRALLKASGS